MREMAQWLRYPAAALGLTLALMFWFSSVNAQQDIVEPIDGDVCHGITASVYPAFES